MSRLFTWLAGLFGVFLILYGIIVLALPLYRSWQGGNHREYDGGATYVDVSSGGYFDFLGHGQVTHLSFLLIMAGLVIVMLTYRRSKPRK